MDITDKLLAELTPEVLAGLPPAVQAAALEKLRLYAFTDQLTELPNRRLFVARLEQILEDARQGPLQECAGIGLLYIDLDRFKAFNDRFGHTAGDRHLRKVADTMRLAKEILEQNLRVKSRPDRPRIIDLLARLGGDEFAVLLCKVTEEQARMVSGRIASKFRENEICASIGALYCPPEVILMPQDVVKAADKMMYDAKRSTEREAHNIVITHFSVFAPTLE